MNRKKASDFPQELLDLFDGYVHGGSAGGNSSMGHKSLRSGASPPRPCSAC